MHKEKRILVASSFFPGESYARFVHRLGGEISYDEKDFLTNPTAFKLVVFTGGEDITPELYGETSPKRMCQNSWRRDELERSVFHLADRHRIKMYGICRGVQFLNVMLGGKMIHHVNGHGGSTHEVTLATGNIVPPTMLVNSLHHQMCIAAMHVYILAWSTKRLSNVYVGDKDEDMVYLGPETESIYSPSFQSMGVQWHPELMSADAPGTIASFMMLKDFMDLETSGFMKKYLPSTSKAYVTIQRPK